MFAVRQINRLALAVVCAIGLSGCSATISTVKGPTPDTAVALGNSWGETLATRDVNRIVSQYADDATLLATFTDKVPSTDDRTKYFEGLSKNNGLRVKYDTQVPAVLSRNSVTLSGLYTFMYEDKRGKTVKVPARYTFVWEKRGGEWKIVKHHSSVRPEKK